MGRLSLITIRMFAPFIGFQEGKKIDWEILHYNWTDLVDIIKQIKYWFCWAPNAANILLEQIAENFNLATLAFFKIKKIIINNEIISFYRENTNYSPSFITDPEWECRLFTNLQIVLNPKI